MLWGDSHSPRARRGVPSAPDVATVSRVSKPRRHGQRSFDYSVQDQAAIRRSSASPIGAARASDVARPQTAACDRRILIARSARNVARSDGTPREAVASAVDLC